MDSAKVHADFKIGAVRREHRPTFRGYAGRYQVGQSSLMMHPDRCGCPADIARGRLSIESGIDAGK